MKKGDILIFNQLTLHRFVPNVSEGVRWSIDIRYTPTGQSFSWHELTGPGFCMKPGLGEFVFDKITKEVGKIIA